MWRKFFAAVVVGGFLGALTLGGSAMAATLSWSGPTTYTDGTLIEPEKTITYDVQVDGATQATGVTGTSWLIPQSLIGHNRTLSFTVRAVLSTGEVSAWAVPFGWTSPAGIPTAPSGLTVTP